MTLVNPAHERALMDDALRAGAMRAPLVSALGLPAGTPCHVIDAKYEPGSSATVLYRLGEQLVTAVVSFGPEAEDDSTGGIPVRPGVRAFAYPDDPRLPGLRLAADPDVLAALLGADAGTRVRTVLLRYRPGKATLRIDLRRKGANLTLIGKVYAKSAKAAAVFDETRRLSGLLGDAPPLILCPAEALVPAIPMVLWPAIAGTDLESRLSSRRGPEHVRAVARGLAALHALPPVSERARPVAAELARFDLRARNVERVRPELGRSLRAWAAALCESGETLEHPEPGLVHGDFKPSQFLLTDSALALLDFDHCGLADPASDVGTFLASLRQRSRAGLEAPFLDAYASAARVHDGRRRAVWYQSVALLRKALRAFARSPRSRVPERLASEGAACLEAMDA